jgi:hypothetical protein
VNGLDYIIYLGQQASFILLLDYNFPYVPRSTYIEEVSLKIACLATSCQSQLHYSWKAPNCK